jgi:hypothetical protein
MSAVLFILLSFCVMMMVQCNKGGAGAASWLRVALKGRASFLFFTPAQKGFKSTTGTGFSNDQRSLPSGHNTTQ